MTSAHESLNGVFDAVVNGASDNPLFMKGFMRGLTGTNDYDHIFDEQIDTEENA